jgi:serine/threonine protein kinase
MMVDWIGQVLGNSYKVISLIARGGMASVYLAQQSSMNRVVAVKILDPNLSSQPEFEKRFQREAQAVALLSHPNILKVFEYGRHEGSIYLAMEYLKGGNLSDRIEKAAIAPAETHRILVQIANAIDYAHRKGVVHRDIKPQNILFDETGNAFLTDFGIVKLSSETSPLTQQGSVVGTPAYIAPEHWLGEAADHRVDIYALGVVVYEMLTGKHPFRGETLYTMMKQHVNDPLPPLSSVKPNLPIALDTVLARAMAKSPEQRFNTAALFARAFEGAINVPNISDTTQLKTERGNPSVKPATGPSQDHIITEQANPIVTTPPAPQNNPDLTSGLPAYQPPSADAGNSAGNDVSDDYADEAVASTQPIFVGNTAPEAPKAAKNQPAPTPLGAPQAPISARGRISGPQPKPPKTKKDSPSNSLPLPLVLGIGFVALLGIGLVLLSISGGGQPTSADRTATALALLPTTIPTTVPPTTGPTSDSATSIPVVVVASSTPTSTSTPLTESVVITIPPTNTPTATATFTATASATHTETATATATLTASSTPPPTFTATVTPSHTATFTATATPNVEQTATAQITSTARAYEAAVNALIRAGEANKFGPEEGILAHKSAASDNNVVETKADNKIAADFVAEATFTNPFAVAAGANQNWDYGFFFRSDNNRQYRFFLRSNNGGEFVLLLREADTKVVARGAVAGLNLSEGGTNSVRLAAEGGRGILFVNGLFVAELDLSARLQRGTISITTGALIENQQAGKTTRYSQWQIFIAR